MLIALKEQRLFEGTMVILSCVLIHGKWEHRMTRDQDGREGLGLRVVTTSHVRRGRIILLEGGHRLFKNEYYKP